MKRVVYVRLVTLCFLCSSLMYVYMYPHMATSKTSGYLSVTFLDVGQGDAIFIETPDGVQVLIDGGPTSAVLTKLSAQMSFFDTTLDMVIGTHPDLDHVGGLVDVLERYQVATILITESDGSSGAADMFTANAHNETEDRLYARAGQSFALGASTTLTVLSPAGNPALLESNTGSIVVFLQYGDTAFVLTGDAPQGIEDYIVSQYGSQLKADVLKLGHHGSDTSSSAVFLKTVAPRYAVVSAGEDNRYGHPHPDVIERVETLTNAQILSTAELGSITFYSDGVKVWLE